MSHVPWPVAVDRRWPAGLAVLVLTAGPHGLLGLAPIPDDRRRRRMRRSAIPRARR